MNGAAIAATSNIPFIVRTPVLHHGGGGEVCWQSGTHAWCGWCTVWCNKPMVLVEMSDDIKRLLTVYSGGDGVVLVE